MLTYPKLVVSICGDSAVGKQTLIDQIASGNSQVLNRFDIGESFTIHATRKITRTRNTPLQSVEEMFDRPLAETIIYRWQFKGDKEIERLAYSYPEAKHRVVLLWRPWLEHALDVVDVHKSWNKSPSGAERMLRKNWQIKLRRRFGPEASLRELGVDVELVRASPPEYPRLSNWSDPSDARCMERSGMHRPMT